MRYQPDTPQLLYGDVARERYADNPEVILPKKWQFLKVETIIKRDPKWKPENLPDTHTPGKITAFIVDVLKELQVSDRERIYVLLTDIRFHIVGLHEVHIGTATESMTHPRELFQAAIASGASFIFMIHNHPSGNLTFSRADRRLMERIKEIGELIGIRLADFIVIGHGGEYLSAVEHELLPQPEVWHTPPPEAAPWPESELLP